MTIQKLRQKLLLLCAICENIPTSEASDYYNNIFSFYSSLRKFPPTKPSVEWVVDAVSIWEIRVHRLQSVHSI